MLAPDDIETRELELKLQVDEDALRAIARAAQTLGLADNRPRRRALQSTYYDTPDHALFKAGVSLRVRRSSGRWLQTVKAGTAVVGGVSNPVEVEHRLHGADVRPDLIPDESVRAMVFELIGKAELRPTFGIRIQRTIVDCISGDTCVEVALDSGMLEWDGGTAPICEAEFELKSGSPAAMADICKQLLADIDFEPSARSKAHTGYALVRGESLERGPVKASKPALEADMSPAQAFATIAADAIGQVHANWSGFLHSDKPEYAHQLRVGLRRLRAAIAVFSKSVDLPEPEHLKASLREMGRIVGPVRDADVLAADIIAPVTPHMHGAPNVEQLTCAIADLAADRRAQARETLAQPAWQAFRIDLALLPFTVATAKRARRQTAETLAAPALDKAWKKVTKRARKIDTLDIEARHEVRKKLKELRYAFEFFGALLGPGAAKAYLKQLKRLQTVFGYLNDAALAQTLPALADAETRAAAGFISGWHSAMAEHEWKAVRERWKSMKATPKPWRDVG
ncbi:CHAD domain-containing protein [Tepidamorphus sp. 3E244]|uniref:CYTH and CHAD domain-containing protein n=1 Tax=Tepidamorphus sp. 3E244 TaxID=3385498 RepID=UPI0038FBF21B